MTEAKFSTNLLLPVPSHLISYTFPVPAIRSGWSTSVHPQVFDNTATEARDEQSQSQSERINHVILDDAELGVHHVSQGTTHEVFTLSDGVLKAWEALYREGSYKPSAEIKGGFGFYLKGPKEEWEEQLPLASEVIFGYAVLFEEGFDFVKGGKLPGICRYYIH